MRSTDHDRLQKDNHISMDKILNFQEELDIHLLDKVVMATMTSRNESEVMHLDPGFFHQSFSSNSKRRHAEGILNQFKNHQDAWQRTDFILAKSQNLQTKVGGLYHPPKRVVFWL